MANIDSNMFRAFAEAIVPMTNFFRHPNIDINDTHLTLQQLQDHMVNYFLLSGSSASSSEKNSPIKNQKKSG